MVQQHTRADVLNAIIEAFGFGSFLEIGSRWGESICSIRCPVKAGVDVKASKGVTHVMTSDEFFHQNKEQWDLVFVDGLHEEGQVMMDLLNALKCLTPGGVVAAHDVSPESHGYEKRGLCWTAWRAWVRLRATRPDLEMLTVAVDHGVGVMRPGRQEVVTLPDPFSYADFYANRAEWLNLKTWEEFQGWLGGK